MTKKLINEKRIESLGIKCRTDLKELIDSDFQHVRSPEEISRRIIILAYLGAYADGVDKDEIIGFLHEEQLWNHLSPNEIILFNKINLEDLDAKRIVWQSECILIFLWTINKISKPSWPPAQHNISSLLDLIPEYLEDTSNFIQNSKYRPLSEILEYYDLVYRFHISLADSKLNNASQFGDYIEILQEWHYALYWIFHPNIDWDEISSAGYVKN